MKRPMISVLICAKNEEKRIRACIESVIKENPNEIILVDGDSTDSTAEIANSYGIKVIKSQNSNLTRDRQIGIDSCSNELIAMIDSDHRLKSGDLLGLTKDLNDFRFDIVQAGLSIEPNGFFCRGEKQYIDLILNKAGKKKMIGVAPCLYRKKVFNNVRFEDNITTSIDDTDFIYRLSKQGIFSFGTGRTSISSLHEPGLKNYYKKFKWYGRGDGEFCIKHPERALSMIFHLIIRYPIIYSSKAFFSGKFFAIPYVIIQGFTRTIFLFTRLVELKFGIGLK
jgi:glycosyltransferase involved in cell wall biosynthesis